MIGYFWGQRTLVALISYVTRDSFWPRGKDQCGPKQDCLIVEEMVCVCMVHARLCAPHLRVLPSCWRSRQKRLLPPALSLTNPDRPHFGEGLWAGPFRAGSQHRGWLL